MKKRLHSYDEVLASYTYYDTDSQCFCQLSGHQTLRTCLVRTALGIYWEPKLGGGPHPILGQEDMETFLAMVESRTDELNCVSTTEAKAIVADLRRRRIENAAALLSWIGSNGLAKKQILRLQSEKHEPSGEWLKGACRGIGVCILKPQELEQARRQYCNDEAIDLFFDQHADFIARDPALLLNADETGISARKVFKVLATAGKMPVTEKSAPLPHFTAMITIAAAGNYHFRPVVIIPGHKSCPDDLLCFREQLFILGSSSGWMTKQTFLIWVQCFLHELGIYKMTIPQRLRSQRFLLFLDGHSSRRSWEGMKLLEANGVDVIIFPAHCTHVMQPFDVAIAAPLKCYFAKNFSIEKISADHANDGRKIIDAVVLRKAVFKTFLQAMEAAVNFTNIQSAFRSAGLSPLDKQKPKQNKFTRQALKQEAVVPPLNVSTTLSNRILTSADGLRFLEANGAILFSNETRPVTNPAEAWLLLTTGNLRDGAFFTGPESFEFTQMTECMSFLRIRNPIPLAVSQLLSLETPITSFFEAKTVPPKDFVHLASRLTALRAIIVCPTCRDTVRFAGVLGDSGLSSIACHGKMDQAERMGIYHDFAEGSHTFFCVTLAYLTGIIPFGIDLIIFLTDGVNIALSPRFSSFHKMVKIKSNEERQVILAIYPFARMLQLRD